MQELISGKNQRIRIGRDIVITFLKICAGRVQMRLDTPRGVSVIREVQTSTDAKGQRPWRNHPTRMAARRLASQPR
jgi:sRNA-binding carbon storage regulator CsrA